MKHNFKALGTVCYIELAPDQHVGPEFFVDLEQIIQEYESRFSRFIETSELSELNRNLNSPQEISDDLMKILRAASLLFTQTNGIFDPTILGFLEASGYDTSYSFQKSEYNNVPLPFAKAVRFLDSDTVIVDRQLDLGGLGKGYALDVVAQWLRNNDISEFMLNFGGDVLTSGEWPITLGHPHDDNLAIGQIKLKDASLASSAAHRRQWGEDLHHLISPQTGLAARSDLLQVFVQADAGIMADGWATALFIAGWDQAIRLSKKRKIPVLLINSEGKFWKSADFAAELFG